MMKDIKINPNDLVTLLKLYYCDFTKGELREILKSLNFEGDSSVAESLMDLDSTLPQNCTIEEGRQKIDEIFLNSEIVRSIAKSISKD